MVQGDGIVTNKDIHELAVAFQAAKAHEGDNDQAIHPIHRHKPLPPRYSRTFSPST